MVRVVASFKLLFFTLNVSGDDVDDWDIRMYVMLPADVIFTMCYHCLTLNSSDLFWYDLLYKKFINSDEPKSLWHYTYHTTLYISPCQIVLKFMLPHIMEEVAKNLLATTSPHSNFMKKEDPHLII